MGTISSGVGLISGLDIASLVSQLMEIEARPLRLLEQRIADTQQQQTAYMELNARLLAAKSAIDSLTKASSFNVKTASSSNESVISATASSTTPLDSYTFMVKSLMTTHQLVSAGFADRDSSSVGAGTLTLEAAAARVDRTTPVSALNGYEGIRRGMIRITDRSGASADIDLRAVLDVDQILDAINSQTDISVRPYVGGEDSDRIVITDETGLDTGSLIIKDLGEGRAAEDLGIAGVHATGQAVGLQLVYLVERTPLSELNDGNGVRVAGLGRGDLRFTLRDGREFDVNLSGILRFGTEETYSTPLAELNDGRGIRFDANGQRKISITNHDGQSAVIDLTDAVTIEDVADAITAAELGISISLSGSKILITDATGGTASNLKIEEVDGGTAAADLGILVDTEDNAFSGTSIYRLDSIGAVLRALQYAPGNEDGALTATLSSNGKGLILTDGSANLFGGTMVQAINGSLAARDLGLLSPADGDARAFDGNSLTSRHLIAGLNTVLLSSLNGGGGVSTGTVTFTRRSGDSFELDFSRAQSLADIAGIINADGRLSAEVDTGGTGIVITDSTTGSGTFSASGAMADDLGLTSTAEDRLASGDLQLQYINEITALADLNLGKGISFGKIQITDSNGQTAVLNLVDTAHETVGDVIDAINALEIGVAARINGDGDGIELVDEAGGSGTLTVAEADGGSTAADLGILGTADPDTNVLTGSFAATIEIDADDTLDDVVEKINSAGAGVKASVINDGTDFAPYRLILSSEAAGAAGRIAFDTGLAGLTLNPLSEGRDAALIVGDPNSANVVVVRSDSNTVTDVVEGLTLNLLATSDEPVQITVSRDIESVVDGVKTFITTFNDAMERIDELTQYIPETEEQGILLGDSTVQRIQARLFRVLSQAVNSSGLKYTRLSDLGVMVSSSAGSGARLTLQRTLTDGTVVDGEAKLREALEEDPEAVEKLFALVEVTTDESGDQESVKRGIATLVDEELDRLTSSVDGVLTRRNNTLQDRVDLYNQRAEDLQELLDRKEARLYAQFQAMERALAALQAQQASLAALASLAASASQGGLQLSV